MEKKENLTAVLTRLLDLMPAQEAIISDYLWTIGITGLLNHYTELNLGEETNRKLEALKGLTEVLDEVEYG